jgi:cytochrome P450
VGVVCAGADRGTSNLPVYCSVAKNTNIHIPLACMNKREDVWGADARDFRPARWLPEERDRLPEGVLEMPSVAFPTFLAGVRGCIGFRFTIIE